MSAYMVSDKHINTLLTWANAEFQGKVYANDQTYDSSQVKDLQELAQVLVDENIRSLKERYPGYNLKEFLGVTGKIEFEFTNGKTFTPVEIIKLCDCYDYQACETGDYETTTANKVVDAIRQKAISMLNGYDQAEWSI